MSYLSSSSIPSICSDTPYRLWASGYVLNPFFTNSSPSILSSALLFPQLKEYITLSPLPQKEYVPPPSPPKNKQKIEHFTRHEKGGPETEPSRLADPDCISYKKIAKMGEDFWCRQCGAKKTPQWREGPDGPRSLCNACGLKFRKIRQVQMEPTDMSTLNT